MATAASKKNARNNTRRMSLKKLVLLVVAAIIFLPLAYACVQFVSIAIASQTAKHSIAAASKTVMTTSDRQFSSEISTLQRAGFIGAEIAKSKVEVCFTDDNHTESWTDPEWYEECYLRYVDGFVAAQPKSAILNDSSLSSTFGQLQNSAYLQQVQPCDIAEQSYSTTLFYRPADTPLENNANLCDIPDPLQGILSIDPIVLDTDLGVKTYYSYNANSVDNSHDQLWVIHETHFYHKDIGCGVGILCPNPRNNTC